ncbi:hypothetical protein M011DRAFT_483392 [Sporormia fimetaria CBS 119925]|uniref:Uncharacterized protein n=1 Tax=Sporormia fimetaria CBS 119925 TaxID=1340428 RepID=A0A6A6VLL1_9PLEO|nr:hypothetical protein M011DRAFT_483392 [Sporormia fimetaria CBS 119925]
MTQPTPPPQKPAPNLTVPQLIEAYRNWTLHLQEEHILLQKDYIQLQREYTLIRDERYILRARNTSSAEEVKRLKENRDWMDRKNAVLVSEHKVLLKKYAGLKGEMKRRVGTEHALEAQNEQVVLIGKPAEKCLEENVEGAEDGGVSRVQDEHTLLGAEEKGRLQQETGFGSWLEQQVELWEPVNECQDVEEEAKCRLQDQHTLIHTEINERLDDGQDGENLLKQKLQTRKPPEQCLDKNAESTEDGKKGVVVARDGCVEVQKEDRMHEMIPPALLKRLAAALEGMESTHS